MEKFTRGCKFRCAAVLIGGAAAVAASGPAGAALSFKASLVDSSVIYTHDVLEFNGPADFTQTSLVPTGTPTSYLLADATRTNLVTVKSEARAAVGQSTGVSAATATFKSGTLLSQSDPGNVGGTTFSTLNMAFFLKWDVTGTGFGPPVSGSFSIPIQATVGVGGEARAQVQIDWGLEDTTTHVFTPLRSQFATTQVYTTTTLTSISVPSAAFSPSALPATSDFVIKGFVKLFAENTTAPTRIYAKPDYLHDVLDLAPTTYFKFDGFETDIPNLGSTGGIGVSTNMEHTAGVDQFAAGFVNGSVRQQITTTSDFSVALWARADVDGLGQATGGSGWFASAAGSGGFEFGPVQGTNLISLTMFDAAGVGHLIGAVPEATLGVYHMYATTYDSATDTVTLLIDGVPQLSAILASLGFARADGLNPIGQSLDLAIGQSTITDAHGSGDIDEFGLFSQALATHELLGLTQLGLAMLNDPGSLNSFAGAQIIVPEPAGLALVAAGLLGMTGRRGRH
jgi:hypothetical protein